MNSIESMIVLVMSRTLANCEALAILPVCSETHTHLTCAAMNSVIKAAGELRDAIKRCEDMGQQIKNGGIQ